MRELLSLDGVKSAGGADVRQARRELGLQLPEEHLTLLAASNGVTLFHGYLRLFGIGSSSFPLSIRDWNANNFWKFAWPADLVGGFLSIGETVWGDQYSYDRDELAGGNQSIYFQDALRMAPRKIADSFAGFADGYMIRNSISPFDSMTRAAFARFGPIPAETHLVFSPPLLVTGDEDLNQAVKLPARAAMILNGDLWTQLSQPPDGVAFGGLTVVVDDSGRERVRVKWSKTGSD